MGRRLERAALVALVVFTVVAVAGFATFGTHPEWLRIDPSAPAMYGAAFVVFARGHVLLAAAALFIVLARRAGKRWIPSLVAIYVVSLSSELAGTTVGLPFGPYSYTDGLGPKWFGHVPLLIPLSWFVMTVPSYAIARRIVGARRWMGVAVGSLVLLSWDLALDPAMSHATKYWVWGASGPYYGMPWLNLFGWYATGLALMSILLVLRSDAWIVALPIRWIGAFYAVNLALSLGICAAGQMTGAVIASAIPLLLCAAALRADRTTASHAPVDADDAPVPSRAEPA